MGTKLKYLDFRHQYGKINQGLFVFNNPKRLPKQEEVNLGLQLSERLLSIPNDNRETAVSNELLHLVEPFSSVSLLNIELLFTPSLRLDVIGTLLALCRNKKICILWPGTSDGMRLFYSYPSSPEYYETDCSTKIDTYLIIE